MFEEEAVLLRGSSNAARPRDVLKEKIY